MYMVPAVPPIFDHHLDFSPEADLSLFLKQAPAKWAVYLFTDADDHPVQLLCVKSLRDSLKRRLGGLETIGLSRRVNYRDLVRHIHYRRVDSTFEADWVYLEAARAVFPQTYQGMVGFRPAWFIHINPAAQFPRYTKTIDLAHKPGLFIGPLEDKHAAARLIELAEDTYDLCRYHNILTESPHGKPCAYKEMGKCPAPCDGTVTLDHYRATVADSATAITDPTSALIDLKTKMQNAAAELRFEVAARLKQKIEQVSTLGKGPFRFARDLEDFRYLSIQRGPREGTARLFAIVKGHIEESAGLTTDTLTPDDTEPLLRHLLQRMDDLAQRPIDQPATERLGLFSHHLFSPRRSQGGVNLHLSDLTDKSLRKSLHDLRKQKPTDTPEGEGILKELQAM